MPRSVAIIGGGITGLAAAHRLLELEPDCQVSLFEAADRLGGILHTERNGPWLVERSADMFTTREPEALSLCQRIGFADQLISPNNEFRQAFVVRRGKLIPVPEGFTLMSPARVWPVLKTPLLSPLGKLRLASEYFVPRRRGDSDESLQSFAVRRFGQEAYERLIQPLIGGIYTADPARLSMAATMPQFPEMEQKHGSCIRAMRAAETQKAKRGAKENTGSGARYGLFVAPRDGMASFIQAIAKRLPADSIRLNTEVTQLRSLPDHRWQLTLKSRSVTGQKSDEQPATTTQDFDQVIVALRVDLAARMLRDTDAALSDHLLKIPLAGASVVVAGYRRDQIQFPLNGFGFVVPAIEKRRILAGSFASVKFSGRAPDSHVLIRTFVGGALQPELLPLSDDETMKLVEEELHELLGLQGEPEFAKVVRWHGTMPQYHVGHLDLVTEIERLANRHPNLQLAGNAYRGVGIPFCVRSGESAAERICKSSTK